MDLSQYLGGAMWLFGGTAGSVATASATDGASLSALPAVGAEAVGIWGHAAIVGGMSI